MTQGSDRSNDARKKARARVRGEWWFFRALRNALRPLNLLQPSPDEEVLPEQREVVGPLEETPEEALERLEREKLLALPPEGIDTNETESR